MCSSAAMGFALASGAYATDYTVNTATTQTNGGPPAPGNLLNGDNLTITSAGSIIVNADGVRGSSNNNYVINAGTITTTGNNGEGIFLRNISSISNNGNVTTSGNNAEALEVRSISSVSNTGSIVTFGTGSEGIFGRNNNMLTNSGSIATIGNNAHGIVVRDGNNVHSTGIIETIGNGAEAIFGRDNNIFLNDGSIATSGNGAEGMQVRNGNNVTNSGNIMTIGNDAEGLIGTDNNLFVNSGLIITSGPQSEGIDLDDSNTIFNSGIIETAGSGAEGVLGDNGNTLTNSGSIFTTGPNSEGIQLDNNNQIDNSGRVVSAQDSAFLLANNNTVNLFAPSFLGGDIDLGTNATLNITTGPSHSVLWHFNPADLAGGVPNSLSGSVPWFYDPGTGTFATYDPSGLSASIEALLDVSAMISGTMQRRQESFDRSGAWAQVIASHSQYQETSTTLQRTINLGGFAAGFDHAIGSSARLGVLGGYASASSNAEGRFANTFKNEKSGWFAAVYGRQRLGSVFIDIGVSGGGHTENENSRFVNDNLAPLGNSFANGDGGKSYWVGPEASIGSQISVGENWSLSPNAKVRYAAEWLNGYTETGPTTAGNGDAIIGERMIAIGEARLELTASRVIQSETMSSKFTARAGVLGRMSLGVDDAEVTLLNITRNIEAGYEDSFSIYAGIDANIELNDRLGLGLSSSATIGNTMHNVQGAATMKVAF